MMSDHVHMLLSIPPKYSVAQVVGFMKGKSAIWMAQNFDKKPELEIRKCERKKRGLQNRKDKGKIRCKKPK